MVCSIIEFSRNMIPLAFAKHSTHPADFEIQEQAQLFDLVRDVANANGAVMGGSVDVPRLDELARAEGEAVTAVRVADLLDRTGHRFSFGNQQLESATRTR